MPALSNLLPALNACLNGACALLLLAGYRLIRRNHLPAHRFCMTAALFLSVLFLTSYLTHHALHGFTRFQGTGWIRLLYFVLLASHTLLAVVIVPLVLRTFSLAWKGRVEAHRPLARRTLPLWLYVSVTGVVVYWMLYRMKWN
jgi:putative membrane protein